MPQTNNLHNYVIHIKDEAMLQEAREILERYGERISDVGQFGFKQYNRRRNYYLQCSPSKIRSWFITETHWDHLDKITLPELEQKLKQKKDGNSTSRQA